LLRLRAPSGEEATLVVQSKATVEPRRVRDIVSSVSVAPDSCVLVLAPFLSLRAREELVGAGAAYADATGNLRIALDKPAVFIETTGASSNPEPEDRPLRSLKGPSAGRVVRALCDFRPPYGVRELAARAGASPASVSRVVDLAGREALLERGARGEITNVDWAALIRRWTQDYAFATSNHATTFLEPRGLDELMRKLTRAEAYAVTGSLPAAALAPVAAPRLAAVYVENAAQASQQLELRAAEAGSNVVLLEPFDSVVFDRTWSRDGITYAALSQVAADLRTGPGRAPAEGTELLKWMGENEDAWRA
jgi:hypothetical protein